MTVLIERMRYFKMDREKEEIKLKVPNTSDPFVFDLGEIPEAELIDYDNEKAQIIIYSKWDRIFDWFRRLAEKIDK